MEPNTQNTMGPAMGDNMGGGSKKSGGGLVAVIVVIVLIIIAVLLLTSKNAVMPNEIMSDGSETTLTEEETIQAQTEVEATLSPSDDVDSLETDLEASITEGSDL